MFSTMEIQQKISTSIFFWKETLLKEKCFLCVQFLLNTWALLTAFSWGFYVQEKPPFRGNFVVKTTSGVIYNQ